jgi:DNA-binding response OmpR family regulator
MFSSVLIVDPDPAAIAFYTAALEQRAHRVNVACDGREGLFELLADPPELLIAEARLPLLNGCDFCTIARREFTVPLVTMIVTALADPAAGSRARACADIVLPKPLDAGLFTQAIDTLQTMAAFARARARRIRGEAAMTRERAHVLLFQSRAIQRKLQS